METSLCSFKDIHELIGNWDDNPLNDLQLPNGTSIPITSSMKDIHYIFGMAWSTTSLTSLFYYPIGLNWSDFQNQSFVPNFQDPPANPVCNDDKECEYDIYVTGSEHVGLSNGLRKQRAREIKEFNSIIRTYCPLSVSVTNGDITIEQIVGETHVRYTVRCNDGFTLFGSEQVTCMDGQYEPIGICEVATSITLESTEIETTVTTESIDGTETTISTENSAISSPGTSSTTVEDSITSLLIDNEGTSPHEISATTEDSASSIFMASTIMIVMPLHLVLLLISRYGL